MDRCPRCGGTLNDDNICPLCGFKGRGLKANKKADSPKYEEYTYSDNIEKKANKKTSMYDGYTYKEGKNNIGEKVIKRTETPIYSEYTYGDTTERKVEEVVEEVVTESYEYGNQEFVRDDDGKKGKKAIAIAITLMILIGITIGTIVGILENTGGERSDFQQNYDTLIEYIYWNEYDLEDICENIASIMYDVENREVTEDMKEFVLDENGNFRSLEDALDSYYSSDDYLSKEDTILDADDEIERVLDEIRDHDLSDDIMFDAIYDFYIHYCSFYNLAFFPPDNYKEFSAEFDRIEETYDSVFNDAVIYYVGEDY